MTRSPDLPPVQRQSRHQSARHSGCVAAVGVCVGRPLPDRGPGRAGRPVPPPAFVTDPSAECRLRLRRRRRSVSCAGRIRGGPRRIAYELAQRVGGPGGRDTNRDPTMPGGSSSGVAPVPCTRKPCRRWLSRRSGRPRGRTASTGRPGRCARVDRLLAPGSYTLESTDGQGVQLLHYMPADLVSRRSPRSTRRAKWRRNRHYCPSSFLSGSLLFTRFQRSPAPSVKVIVIVLTPVVVVRRPHRAVVGEVHHGHRPHLAGAEDVSRNDLCRTDDASQPVFPPGHCVLRHDPQHWLRGAVVDDLHTTRRGGCDAGDHKPGLRLLLVPTLGVSPPPVTVRDPESDRDGGRSGDTAEPGADHGQHFEGRRGISGRRRWRRSGLHRSGRVLGGPLVLA